MISIAIDLNAKTRFLFVTKGLRTTWACQKPGDIKSIYYLRHTGLRQALSRYAQFYETIIAIAIIKHFD